MASLNLRTFSKKQRIVFTWWKNNAPDFDGIICDGAIRSGKTSCMALSFVIWASVNFQLRSFAFCGKTISSLKRNMLEELIPRLESLGFTVKNCHSKNYLDISLGLKPTGFIFSAEKMKALPLSFRV